MSDPVTEALRSAIETKRRELGELEAALRKHQDELASGGQKFKRTRKRTGFKVGSIPYRAQHVLGTEQRPLTAAELAERVSANGKQVDSRTLASSLARYIGGVFERTLDGSYILK